MQSHDYAVYCRQIQSRPGTITRRHCVGVQNSVLCSHKAACLQAVEAGRVDVTQKLIDFGVQLAVFDAQGNTPLHLAVKVKVNALHLTCLSVCMTLCHDLYGLHTVDGPSCSMYMCLHGCSGLVSLTKCLSSSVTANAG